MNDKPPTQTQPQPQPQPPQKCPRCDSLNTKFCYYNNYSLSQPRYFCKSCRRYWTQGGTLRNVRVGGGCRKAKRAKSSASSSSADTDPPPPPQEAVVQKDPSSAVGSPPPAAVAPAISPFYQGGGGYLSSLAAIQSLNASQQFNQMGGGSNLSLLSGFGVPSLGPQIRPSQFYQVGVIGEREEESVCEAEQGLIRSTTTGNGGSDASGHDWTESFIHNASQRGSDVSLWSTSVSTTSSGGNSESANATAAGPFSLIPNHHWPHLPGYDPPL